jgi:glycosyltransferase involved in cell wall biosynthesis
LLVPPRDVDSLTDALLVLLRDNVVRETMGENARRYVLAEADSETCLKRLESFYLSVASRRMRTETEA